MKMNWLFFQVFFSSFTKAKTPLKTLIKWLFLIPFSMVENVNYGSDKLGHCLGKRKWVRKRLDKPVVCKIFRNF